MIKPRDLFKTSFVFVVMLLLFVLFASVRIINLSSATKKVKVATDTYAYERISEYPLESLLTRARPPVFTLVLKFFSGNREMVAWAQGIFSILCWGGLAVCVAQTMRVPLLSVMVFGLFLLLSLYRRIIGWDATILTESISISLMALFLAACLWLIKGWRWFKVLVVIVVACVWAFSRDTNAWILLMIAVPIFLLAVTRKIERKHLAIAVSFLIIFYLSNLSANLGWRWLFPFQNILGHRILTNPQAVEYFSKCGMPVTPRLVELAGEYAGTQDRAFYRDPDLETYREWLKEKGKACYIGWLLSKPLESIREPLADFNALITLEHINEGYFSKRFSPILPARVEALTFPATGSLIIFTGMNIVAVYVLTSALWKENQAWLIFAGLSFSIFPHYFLIWHGDVIGIYRHALSAGIQYYLSIWLMVVLAVDRIVYKYTKK